MTAVIISIVSFVILAILYRGLIQKEIPAPIGKMQAVLPVLLGIGSLFLSFFFYIGIIRLISIIGFNPAGLPLAVRSLRAAFFKAGLPEEIAKLVVILISLALLRPKIRNVYEYVLTGAAVGMGFTLLEEFLYSSDSLFVAAGRLITVASHMIFGIIMGKHLGMANYKKKTGEGSAAGEAIAAILVPLAIHTLYDACTACNMLLESETDALQTAGMVLSIAAMIALFVLQIAVIRKYRRCAERYCNMKV